MSTAELSRVESLDALSGFRQKLVDLWAALNGWCADKPFHVLLAQGARTAAEQMDCWAQGRLELSRHPAPWGTWVREGPVVTFVLPPNSAHCYAVGADFAFVDETGPGEWLPATVVLEPGAHAPAFHPAWLRLRDEAVAAGLATGLGLWGWDVGHVQLPGFRELAAEGKLSFLG